MSTGKLNFDEEDIKLLTAEYKSQMVRENRVEGFYLDRCDQDNTLKCAIMDGHCKRCYLKENELFLRKKHIGTGMFINICLDERRVKKDLSCTPLMAYGSAPAILKNLFKTSGSIARMTAHLTLSQEESTLIANMLLEIPPPPSTPPRIADDDAEFREKNRENIELQKRVMGQIYQELPAGSSGYLVGA